MIAETKDNDDDSSDYENNLEVNWNHVWREEYKEELEKYGEVINTTGIDEFLAKTDKNEQPDLHPERRMKASWKCFVEERMDKMKKENPSLKRSQIIQLLSKEWKTYSENPIVKAKAQGTTFGEWRDAKHKAKKE